MYCKSERFRRERQRPKFLKKAILNSAIRNSAKTAYYRKMMIHPNITENHFQKEDARNLHDFILRGGAYSSNNRMLSSNIQFFYKAFPEAKDRIRKMKVKEFCKYFPGFFAVEHDGKAGTF